MKSGLNIFEEMSKTLPRVLMRLCDTKLAEEAFLCTEDGPTFKDSANIHFEKLPELSCYFAGRKLDPTLGSFFALVPAVFIHKLGGIDYYRLKPYNTDLQLSEEETGEFTDSLRISRMALEALAKEPQFQFNLLDIRGEEPAFVRTPSPRELLIYPGYYKEQDKQVITLYDFRTRRSRIIPSQGIRLTTVLRSHPQDGPGLAFAALQVKENVADRVLHSIIGVWEEEPHSGGSSWEFQFPYLDLGKEDVYALFGARDGDRYRIVASILQKEPQVAIGLHCKGKEIFRTHFYAEGNALDSCAAFPLESTAGKEWYLLGCADGALYLWKWDTNQRQDYRRKMHLAAEGKLSKLEVQAREEGIVVLVGDERNHKLHILTMDPGSESMEAIQGIEAYRGLFAVHADNRLVAMRSDGHAFVTHRKLGNRYHEEHTQMLDAAFDAVIGIEMDERGTAYVLGPKRCLRVEGAAISSVEPLPYTPFLYGKNYGFAGGRNP
ncbi:hypothetical protein HYS48_04570 [Candidatus Woesearchaeota archaeon]|nr:hypothetical protein [Candidatus Woesearchaeota archaeon]